MGIYRRKDSPWWWLWLERPTGPAVREATKIPAHAATPQQRKDNRQLAERAYHDRMAALAKGDSGDAAPKPAITFEDFSQWYETHVSAHKRGAVREREILVALRRHFGPELLNEITKTAVLEWRTARAAKVSVGTTNRETDVLKHVLASAVPQYLDASPIAGLKRLRGHTTEPLVLTRADERKLLKVLSPSDKALVILALDTLMRLSDALRLEWAHHHGTYLSVVDPKTAQPYKVPISSRLRRTLKALPRDHKHVFWSHRLAVNERDWRTSVRHMLEDACKAALVRYGRGEGITFHSLRHTGTSRMVAAGVDLRTVQAIGGWASLRQLSRYAHPTDRAKRRAVELVHRAGA